MRRKPEANKCYSTTRMMENQGAPDFAERSNDPANSRQALHDLSTGRSGKSQ